VDMFSKFSYFCTVECKNLNRDSTGSILLVTDWACGVRLPAGVDTFRHGVVVVFPKATRGHFSLSVGLSLQSFV
jgi:hypothetical protein